jgi:tryptophan synthase alpha chain
MTRIGEAFSAAKKRGNAAFVGFLTAGDPSLEAVEEVAVHAEGLDVLELGVPFSDPVADGPVIQRSSERALARGTTLEEVLRLAARIRKRREIPLLLFSYLNPLLRLGLGRAAASARDAGVDGILVTDLPPEEADSWLEIAWREGLDTVFLASPTSPDARLIRVARASRGFVYAISRTGVTGEQGALSEEAAPLAARLRAIAPIPVALGFGISTPAQVKAAAEVADGVVVGSAFVRFLEENPPGKVGEWIEWLKGGR